MDTQIVKRKAVKGKKVVVKIIVEKIVPDQFKFEKDNSMMMKGAAEAMGDFNFSPLFQD